MQLRQISQTGRFHHIDHRLVGSLRIRLDDDAHIGIVSGEREHIVSQRSAAIWLIANTV